MARFVELLDSKNSPASGEATQVWGVLVDEGVDPSFALAQFRVESQYGTSGWAKETGSWGNMLYSPGLTILSGPPESFYTSSNHKYTFATYTSYVDAVKDYCRYIHWYRDQYALETIYEATGRWLGLNRTGDTGHINYVNTIINDMVLYEHEEGDFYEVGDKVIYIDNYVDRSTGRFLKRLEVKAGTVLYRGTNGDILKKLSPPTGVTSLKLLCAGPVQGSNEWAAVLLGTADGGRLAYVQNPDWTKLSNA